MFDVDQPVGPCYAVFLGVLRSYDGMGKYEVRVTDTVTGKVKSQVLDGQWAPRISVGARMRS